MGDGECGCCGGVAPEADVLCGSCVGVFCACEEGEELGLYECGGRGGDGYTGGDAGECGGVGTGCEGELVGGVVAEGVEWGARSVMVTMPVAEGVRRVVKRGVPSAEARTTGTGWVAGTCIWSSS